MMNRYARPLKSVQAIIARCSLRHPRKSPFSIHSLTIHIASKYSPAPYMCVIIVFTLSRRQSTISWRSSYLDEISVRQDGELSPAGEQAIPLVESSSGTTG